MLTASLPAIDGITNSCLFAAASQDVEKSQVFDPARHLWAVLAAFLESITDEDALKLVDRHVKWERQIQAVRVTASGINARRLICHPWDDCRN